MTQHHHTAPSPSVIVLGEGILTWPAAERQTGRYGTVWLGTSDDATVSLAAAPVGTHGHLVAVVLATRRSSHIGDIARGITPTTPTIGEEITLGVGELFVTSTSHHHDTVHLVGLDPDDGRETDWLDPGALYRNPRELHQVSEKSQVAS